jgi:membrane protein implicated in regulation of membrane protease activity
MEWLLNLFGSWTWLVIGAVLLSVELVLPGIFFLWVGLAGIIIGLLHLVFPLSPQVEVVLFGALSIVLLLVARPWLMKRQALESDRPHLNRRMSGYVGRHYVLDEPLKNGRGRLRIDDTYWNIEGPDLPKGASVKVVAVDDATLRVQPLTLP